MSGVTMSLAKYTTFLPSNEYKCYNNEKIAKKYKLSNFSSSKYVKTWFAMVTLNIALKTLFSALLLFKFFKFFLSFVV